MPGTNGQRPHDDYRAFLEAKAAVAPHAGFNVALDEIHPALKPHQRAAVQWATRGGRRALFESFGLGKTLQQLEIVRLTLAKSGGRRGLIVCPLGVRQEFVRDAAMIGLSPTFVRSHTEASADGIYLTNYESVREGKLDPRGFDVITLDEAAILRGFGGTKTFRQFMAMYEGTAAYRFVATAVPSPNEYLELAAYSAFLGIMDVSDVKTRFFRRDSTKADHLTLHPHKAKEFWLWCASWGLFVQKPSDLCGCLCHSEKNWRDSDSGISSSTNGYLEHSATARGDAAAIAEEHDSHPRATCSKGGSSAADASAPDMAAREPAPTESGAASSSAARGQCTRTGATTAVEGSPSVNAGDVSPTSSPTWASRQPMRPSTASTTTGTTNQATAAGRHDSIRPETADPVAKRLDPEGRGWCDSCRCDEGYVLPPMDVRWHEVPTDHARAGIERDGQARMFVNTNLGVTEAAREKRESLSARIAKLMELRAEDPSAHRLIWHDLEDERRAIERAIPDVVTVYGSQDLDERESAIIAFSDGQIQELAGKPVMLGSGTNFQRYCAWAIFLGIGFKFNDFIQACHRLHRFLQTRPVHVDLIYTEAEREVRRVLEEKWRRHAEQMAQMSAIIREYGLAEAALAHELGRSLGVERAEASGEGWRLIHNDAVLETRAMPADSVDLIITSIPFANQYAYSPNFADLGHTDDTEHFWRQMDFLSPELLRALKPGRMMAIHVKDRITPGGINGLGFQTVTRISDQAADHYERHGFAFLARKTIATDVVRENNQTYRLGWTEQCKDGSRMGCGLPEYVLLFRKPPTDRSNGYADVPVVKDKPLCDDHGTPAPFDPRTNWRRPIPGTGYSRARWQMDAHGFARSSGDRLLSPEEIRSLPHERLYKLWRDRSRNVVYDFNGHVRVAEELDHEERLPATFMLLPPHSWHPDVWTDVARMRTLNTFQAAQGKEQHLCPLPLDIVGRLIVQFSMPGEVVYDPFCGIGTVPHVAVKTKRRGLGVELSAAYFQDATYWCRDAERSLGGPTLLDLLGEAEAQ